MNGSQANRAINSAGNAISSGRTRGRPKGSVATPKAIRELLRALAYCDYSAAEIGEILAKKLGTQTPTPRTIREFVHRNRPRDLSEPWSFGDTEPHEDRLVLNVRAGAREATGGRVQNLTIEEARLAIHVSHAAPDLDPQTQWWFVLWYAMRAHQPRVEDRSTADLDGYLDFAPWTSKDAQGRYDAALARGFFEPLPLGLYEGLELYSYGDLENYTYAQLEGTGNAAMEAPNG